MKDPAPVIEALILILMFLFGAFACTPQHATPVADWRDRTGIAPDSISLRIEEARRMNPVQQVYSKWAKQMYACLSRLAKGEGWQVSLKTGIKVYTAEGITRDSMSGAGIYLWPNTIVVLEDEVATEEVVKHELGHIFCPTCPHPIIEHCANPEAR